MRFSGMGSTITLERLTMVTVLGWWVVCSFLLVASFGTFLTSISMMAIYLPVLLVALTTGYAFFNIHALTKSEAVLVLSLIVIWLLHATGLLVPETGFDAVWYHLPVAEAMVSARGFVYFPELYQTINPLFSDIAFIAGYGVMGDVGAKIVAYAFGITLVLVVYQLARLRLSVYWSLWVVLMISTFQVVTWQVSSFYVDVAKAMWEVAALWLLLKSNVVSNNLRYILSGLLFGASLGTKAFSWLLWPVYATIVILRAEKSKLKQTVLFLTATGAVAALIYIRPWAATGNPFISISLHLGKLDQIGGEAAVSKYIVDRVYTFPSSLLELTFLVSDYVSLGLIVLMPVVIWQVKSILHDEVMKLLLIFGVTQYCLWWFVPPLSTRYAISGFAVLILVWVFAVVKTVEKDGRYYRPLVLVLFFAILINLLPRFIVAKRNLNYLLKPQTKSEYIEQFYDGSIDEKLKLWHRL